MKFITEEWYYHEEYGLIQYFCEMDLAKNLSNRNDWVSLGQHILHIFMDINGKILYIANTENIIGTLPEERDFIDNKKIELL